MYAQKSTQRRDGIIHQRRGRLSQLGVLGSEPVDPHVATERDGLRPQARREKRTRRRR